MNDSNQIPRRRFDHIVDYQMTPRPIGYDGIAETYDLYVTAEYDIPFFMSEVVFARFTTWR